MTLDELYQAHAIAKDYEAAEDRISMLTNAATVVPPLDIIAPAGVEGGTTKVRIDAEQVRRALVASAMMESAEFQTSLINFGIVLAHHNEQPNDEPIVAMSLAA